MKDASKFKWPKGLKRTKTRKVYFSFEVSKSLECQGNLFRD